MSNLQLFGLVLSAVLLYVIVRYYRARQEKTPLTIGLLTVVSLALVSYTPDTFNAFFNLITRSQNQFYRIIILLILGIVFLFVLQLRNLFLSESHERALAELVHRHTVKEYQYEYDEDEIASIQIVVPAYNEADNLQSLLDEIPDSIEGTPVNLLIVSDGSDDDTKTIAEEHDYPVVENLVNRGGGLSLQAGFDIVTRNGAEIIVTMDADGQHAPADLDSLVQPILNDEADYVVGSRRLGETHQTNLFRRTGIYFFNRLISLLMGRTITDCSSGYRAFTTGLVEQLDLQETRYHTTEFLIQAINAGARYKEVPITVRKRSHGTSKKGRDLFYGFRFFKVLFRTWWKT